MSTLTTTFGYNWDTLVEVRVSSENFFGTSATLQNLDGARIRRVPDTMA